MSREVRGNGRLGRILISSTTGKDSVEHDKRKERQRVETAEGSNNNTLSTVDLELYSNDGAEPLHSNLTTDKKAKRGS